ncbi:hypothetical protein ACFY40_11370 [Streptomyces sp. NPDC012950]|uniref:hypothetical protein n=1 Tax=Streptomyces sp. NPDC012950 TaxID=3364858 RepID=UPI003680CB8A
MTLDVSALVENNVYDLLDLLASEEFHDAYMEIVHAEPSGEHDGHAPERFDTEHLVAALVERLATKVALSPLQALRVSRRVSGFAEPMVAAARAAEDALLAFAMQKDRRAS